MYPATIEEYVRPGTIDEALKALGKYEEGDAVFIAGGQSLMQAVKSRLVRPKCIVDLQAISELRGISVDGGGAKIGATTRYREIARDEQRNSVAVMVLMQASSYSFYPNLKIIPIKKINQG